MLQAVRNFLERFGDLLSRWILSLLYLVLVTPIGLVFTYLRDPLGTRTYGGTSFMPWKHRNHTLDEARRQVS